MIEDTAVQSLHAPLKSPDLAEPRLDIRRLERLRSVDGVDAYGDELMRAIVHETLEHPDGRYAGGVARAERFLPAAELPTAPPLA